MYRLLMVLTASISVSLGATITITSPKANNYLPRTGWIKVKWEAPASVGGAFEMRLIGRNGADVMVGTGTLQAGEAAFCVPVKVGNGDGYKLVITSRTNAAVSGEVGLLTVYGPVPDTRKVLFNVSLEWRPTLPPAMKNLSHIDCKKLRASGISQLSIIDKRSSTKFVGGFYEDDDSACTLPVTVKDTVALWLRRHLDAVFMEASIIRSGESRNDCIVELIDFHIEERDKYSGIVLTRTTILRDGKPLWTGFLRGTAATWGKTYTIESYRECIADAVVVLGTALLENLAVALENAPD